MTLSLCMIVRDEGAVLGRCLQSAAPLCDEIVVADTGSKDDTKKIALSFTDKVFDFAWREDFAAARNFAFAQAKGDYLLWLDADEVLLPRAAQALRALKERLRADACRLRTEIPDGRGGVALAFERVRIVRKEAGFLWHGRVHEYIAAGGDVARADIAVTHLGGPKRDPFRNLKIFARAFASGGSARRAADLLLCARAARLRHAAHRRGRVLNIFCAARGGRRIRSPRARRSLAAVPPAATGRAASGRCCAPLPARLRGRRRAARWATACARRAGLRTPPFGTGWRCASAPPEAAGSPAPTAAALSPAYGCACAAMRWATPAAPPRGTSAPRGISRRTRACCTTAPFLTACFRKNEEFPPPPPPIYRRGATKRAAHRSTCSPIGAATGQPARSLRSRPGFLRRETGRSTSPRQTRPPTNAVT